MRRVYGQRTAPGSAVRDLTGADTRGRAEIPAGRTEAAPALRGVAAPSAGIPSGDRVRPRAPIPRRSRDGPEVTSGPRAREERAGGSPPADRSSLPRTASPRGAPRCIAGHVGRRHSPRRGWPRRPLRRLLSGLRGSAAPGRDQGGHPSVRTASSWIPWVRRCILGARTSSSTGTWECRGHGHERQAGEVDACRAAWHGTSPPMLVAPEEVDGDGMGRDGRVLRLRRPGEDASVSARLTGRARVGPGRGGRVWLSHLAFGLRHADPRRCRTRPGTSRTRPNLRLAIADTGCHGPRRSGGLRCLPDTPWVRNSGVRNPRSVAPPQPNRVGAETAAAQRAGRTGAGRAGFGSSGSRRSAFRSRRSAVGVRRPDRCRRCRRPP